MPELHDRVERVSRDELIPYSNNPKEHPEEQVNKIASSIKNYGWDQPIVVDGGGEIIKGHGRLQAAEKLGLDEVPVIWREDLSDAEAKAARIADNKTAESDWLDDELATELEVLEDFEAEELGFDNGEIEELLDDIKNEDVAGVDYTPGSLSADFGIPPFSIFDTRQGAWQDRKEEWTNLGLGDVSGRDHGNATSIESQESLNKLGSDYQTGVSIFDPVLAELLYRWFSPEDGQIIDPFAGGAARAIVASVTGRRYFGVDINPQQVKHNRQTWSTLAEVADDLDKPPLWKVGDSANMDTHLSEAGIGGVDFLFSCPPYHDLENYTDDPNDLSNMDYEEFIDTYREVIRKSVAALKDNRFAAFVVSEVRDRDGVYRGLVPDTIRAFEKAGANLYNEAILVNSAGTLPMRVRNQFETGRKLGRQHQNVLVFYKGDPDPKTIGGEIGEISVPDSVSEEPNGK